MKLNLKRPRAIICLLAILLTHPTLPSFSAETAKNAHLISLEAEDETLKGVLAKITNDTAYRILLSEDWENMPITIKLNNETLEGALSRVLRGLNYAITWDETEKKISLFICSPAKCSGIMWNVSLSGQKTEFDQATSTIVK